MEKTNIQVSDELLAAILLAGALSNPEKNPPDASMLASWIALAKEAAEIATPKREPRIRSL